MMRRPVSSPAAPAGGWKVAADIPVSRHRMSSASRSTARAPWANDAGVAGCRSRNPPCSAAQSHTFGLYFMVHDPRGYAPTSTAKLRCARRVKWATRSRSESSGSPGGVSAASGSGGPVGTSSVGSDQARRSGTDSSRRVGSVAPPTSGDDAARPAASGTIHHLSEGSGVPVELLPGAALGDGDEEPSREFRVVGGEGDSGEKPPLRHGGHDAVRVGVQQDGKLAGERAGDGGGDPGDR